MKIKVLVMGVGNLVGGGVETIVLNLYRSIDKNKFQIDFLSHCKLLFEDELVKNGSNVYHYTMRSKNPIKFYLDLKAFFKHNRVKYDYVWIHQSSPLKITANKFIKKYTKAKIINHCHNTEFANDNKFIYDAAMRLLSKINYRKFIRLTDYMLACSLEAGKSLYKSNNENRIVVFNNGISPDDFIFDSDIRIRKRKELGIENRFVIGHIGRFAVQKNHDFIIKVFKQIHIKNNNSVLLLIGDGELRGNIEKKVESLGLKESVIFTGVRSDIPNLLCAMDIFLFPSLWEGLGIVLIEAQTAGLHCIASDVIPKESQVTELIEYISLNESSSYWADKVLKYASGYERKDMKDKIENAGFNIKKVAKDFEKFLIDNKTEQH